MRIDMEVRRESHLPFITVPDWGNTCPEHYQMALEFFEKNPDEDELVFIEDRVRIVRRRDG